MIQSIENRAFRPLAARWALPLACSRGRGLRLGRRRRQRVRSDTLMVPSTARDHGGQPDSEATVRTHVAAAIEGRSSDNRWAPHLTPIECPVARAVRREEPRGRSCLGALAGRDVDPASVSACDSLPSAHVRPPAYAGPRSSLRIPSAQVPWPAWQPSPRSWPWLASAFFQPIASRACSRWPWSPPSEEQYAPSQVLQPPR